MFKKDQLLFVILAGFFISNALIAEFIGVKIFALEASLGMDPLNWNLFGQKGSLSFTAGVLLWPIVFIMTDVINEYYGQKGVRLLSYLAVGLISYAFIMAYGAINLAPADWWVGSFAEKGVPDMQEAFRNIFGQGMWIIVGSLVAFFLGQILDVIVFHKIRSWTGESKVWLRATGSTIVSQLIDSLVVLYIAFVLGPAQWSLSLFFAVATVNYVYKVSAAILLTPAIYGAHYVIDKFLGEELAGRLKAEAATST
ncbi:MAG: queuosine precursor transporter [Bacteroidia bacterium]|nr:queuosine precursor transporter [Bacteroidia bacterium]